MAALAFTNLTSGQTTNASSVNTSSITPIGNNLILLAVFSVVGSGAANIPTASGNGITWVEITHLNFSTSEQITIFRGMVTSPSAGQITISFGGQSQNSIGWIVDQVSGVDTTGTNGSGAVVQSATGSSTSPLSISLSAFSSSQNVTYGATGYNTNQGITHGGNFTELAQTSTNISIESEYALSNQTTVNWTYSAGSTTTGGIAIEIKAQITGLLLSDI